MRWLKQKKVVIQLLIGLAGITLAGIVFFINATTALPNPGEIGEFRASQSTKIFDRSGENLLYEIYSEEKRTVIPSEEIPDIMRQATVSIEDDTFYTHPAFDWRGILRAVFVNAIKGRFAQGGSTITQQLAKNTFLSPEKTISRKLKELILAMRLEQRYSKDEILDLYLNQIPYGGSTYGIEAASNTFFGKSARDLNLSEASLLAALPQSPSYFSPWGGHTDELEERRKFVLKRMRELGYIDEEQFLSATDSPPEILSQPETGIQAPHFVISVQDYLRDKYGEDALRTDGFRVITTLDKDLQKIAEDVVERGVERNKELYGGENGALLAMDPKTGQVLAMVGSKNYFGDPEPEGCTPGKNCRFEGNFNVAVQGLRQPGSALKPFAYLTAFKEGFTPDTVVWDVATEFNTGCPAIVNYSAPRNGCYHPRNYDLTFHGPVTMKEALAQSRNIPSIKTLYLAGLENTIQTTKDFGITTLNDPSRLGLSLVLGGGEIKMIELLGAYAALANDGVANNPSFILKIEDGDGDVLEEYEDKGERSADPKYVRIINDILSSGELRAPLYHQSAFALTQVPGHQVALKTGTTDNFVDAWAFGYTPNLAVGIWAGNNNREPLKGQASSILAAIPMWHDFMSNALQGKPLETFPRPEQLLSNNPVLNGELPKNNLRSILYYLNRVNDPQFKNWETGVETWLRSNSVGSGSVSLIDDFDLNTPSNRDGKVSIEITSPTDGSFFSGNIPVSFSVDYESKIKKVEILFNGTLVDEENSFPENRFSYNKSLEDSSGSLQVLVTIRVVDSSNSKIEKGVIVFKK